MPWLEVLLDTQMIRVCLPRFGTRKPCQLPAIFCYACVVLGMHPESVIEGHEVKQSRAQPLRTKRNPEDGVLFVKYIFTKIYTRSLFFFKEWKVRGYVQHTEHRRFNTPRPGNIWNADPDQNIHPPDLPIGKMFLRGGP